MRNLPSHLFIIDPHTFNALTEEEITATVAGLKEAGLYHLPYETISVRMLTDQAVHGKFDLDKDHTYEWLRVRPEGGFGTKLGPAHWTEVRGVNLHNAPIEVHLVHGGADRRWKPYDIVDSRMESGVNDRVADMLITLLATTNAVKTTERNACARLGIGGKKPGSTKRYEYVTTISLPHADTLTAEDRTGDKRCPHLRRGHVRRQRYGAQNAFMKLIWIAPMFIHVDEEWTKTRTAYNLSAKHVQP